MIQSETIQYEKVYNEIDKDWNYACNISYIRTFKMIYDKADDNRKLLIIFNNGSDVTINRISTEYYMKFLSCVSRYKQSKNVCDFLIMTQKDVYLLTDINY